MDFTQASVRGQFEQPERVLERSRQWMEQARQIWFQYQERVLDPGPQYVLDYLRAVEGAANAVASIHGLPLTERRFLLDFPGRTQAVNRPGLYPGLLGLIGAPNLAAGALKMWLPDWQAAYSAVPDEQTPARLHPDRLLYYRNAFEVILESGQPEAALWPMLRTWTIAAAFMPKDAPAYETWYQALAQLGLVGDAFESRLNALDAYLDLVDETLEEWAHANGVWVT
jgi:hypothetical protein